MNPDIPTSSQGWRFGVFEVSVRAGELLRRGVKVKLQDQPFRVLLVLLENAGEVVTREELRQKIWPDGTFVDFENGLNSAINRLRDALGDSAEKPHYIETLPRRGYRFIASVESRVAAQSAASGAAAESSRVAAVIPAAASAATNPLRRAWAYLGGLLVLVAAIGLFALWRNTRAETTTATNKIMLAVLPFENLTGSSDLDYFVDGVNEEIISSLGRLRPAHLGVIARTSILQYKESRKPIDQIGRELKVNYVLEGSVRRDGDRVRVTAQLIQVADQTHLWADNFEREFRDSLKIQADIAGRVARTLAMELLPAEQAAQARQLLINSEARTEYMKGRHLWNRRAENFPELAYKAIEHYHEALRLEPSYALAWASLADAYNNLGTAWGEERTRWFTEARQASARALELDSNLAAAHSASGWTTYVQDHNFPKAEAAFKRAVELEPNFADGHLRYAQFLGSMGRYREGEQQARQAIVLDPMSLMNNNVLLWMLWLQQRHNDAIDHYRSFSELSPDPARVRFDLASMYARVRDCVHARQEFQKAKQVEPQPKPPNLLSVIIFEQRCGSQEAAARAAQEAEAHYKKNERVSFTLVALYDMVGKLDAALQYLDGAERRNEVFLIYLNLQSYSDALRFHPRVQALRQRLGLPEPEQPRASAQK